MEEITPIIHEILGKATDGIDVQGLKICKAVLQGKRHRSSDNRGESDKGPAAHRCRERHEGVETIPPTVHRFVVPSQVLVAGSNLP